MDPRTLAVAAATAFSLVAYFSLRRAPTSVRYLKHAVSKTDRYFTTSGGRRLCYRVYGTPSGRPILFLHGMPGSRYCFGPDAEQVCKDRNLFVVCPDRPGYGLSSLDPEGTTISVVRDLADLMLAILAELERSDRKTFEVVGYSNGGPFALALARQRPELLSRCWLAAPGGFTEQPGILDALAPQQKQGHMLIRNTMWLVRIAWLLAAPLLVNPASYFAGFESALSPVDKAYLAERPQVREFWVDYLVGETFRQGIYGMLHEVPLVMGRVSPSGFGFDVRDVDTSRVPVAIYSASHDTLVSAAQCKQLHELVGGSMLVEVEGGHVSVLEKVFRELL
ncbi:Alpha/Beta hydrolase protein [Hyaloraphidium curvatum]|nr:Alpha/Beta hydrolase protein [Hyaloraphidium curvatum]